MKREYDEKYEMILKGWKEGFSVELLSKVTDLPFDQVKVIIFRQKMQC